MCRGRREGLGNLTVRNLDDWVIEELKAEAKANERSLEGEVRHVLTQRVGRRNTSPIFAGERGRSQP